MKKGLKRLSSLLVVLFCNISFAAPDPPAPAAPVLPGLPIDSSIYVLMVIGIVYVVIDFKRRQKNSQFEE